MTSKQFLTHFIPSVGIFISIVIAAATTTTTIVESSHKSISWPNCPDHCGEVKVPCPFGITPGCSLPGNGKFYPNCTQSSLYLNSSNLQVTNITVDGEAFVVEQGMFNFSNSSFRELNRTELLPIVFNWGIGNDSCDEAKKRANYACKGNNVKCVNASNAAGYLCRCLPDYEGNPHVPDGCHDIDECKDPNSCAENSHCQNLAGNWTCICPEGYHYGKETGCSNSNHSLFLLNSNSNHSRRLVLLLCIAMAMELEGQRAMDMHQWGTGDVGSQETEYLLTEDPPSDLYSIYISEPMCSQEMSS
ncbi:hypothetical protein FEM48_Zijuj01G0101900 [Ziziphus jujuba var. spinosa]|uniref:EGF-like domain-containing protein n=1 Tax=Ziziphus jujuba var. spinosa TaxID=714518 RepID=A0A978W0N0_ZIZJJ|nr:hypothetical protein FEM48_Zijuj01G0101900 [Ziziphus jujuba var. spinosa]